MEALVPLDEIFTIAYGTDLEQVRMTEIPFSSPESIAFVSRKESNNGVATFVKRDQDISPNPSNTLSVAGGGSAGACFFHSYEYYSGRDILILMPKNGIFLKTEEFLAYASYINANRYRFNYGRQANTTLGSVLVPKKIPTSTLTIISDALRIGSSRISSEPVNKDFLKLNSNNWKYFKLKDLFNIAGSVTTKPSVLRKAKKGKYPYVTTSSQNNAVADFYSDFTEEGNVLVIDSAVNGHCTFQENNFLASDHVEKLIPKFKMTKSAALFFVTILNKEKYRYNYGRKASQDRLETISIKLPSKNNDIDLEFMEKFINTCKFSKALESYYL